MWDPDGISSCGTTSGHLDEEARGWNDDMLGSNFHLYYNIFLFPM